MKIKKTTEYAILILRYIHYTPSGDMPTAQMVSEAIGITYPHVIKIADLLKKRGLISSVRGRNGGYQMMRPASKISVYDVVLAVEGELKVSPNLMQGARHCSMQAYFHEVRDMLIETLSSKKIVDL
ncbi:MAG: Rrf2 family transcriptional regulator [Oscillospiraceae bacterium]|nr:Rrf2 family transcriptional regulator [Oscillospiraceae bacterium]